MSRLAAHCDRLAIGHPSTDGLRAELESAVEKWQSEQEEEEEEEEPAHASAVAAAAVAAGPAAQGQGLFRVEWTAAGSMNLAARILPHIPDTQRESLTAVSLPAPTWGGSAAGGAYLGAAGPVRDVYLGAAAGALPSDAADSAVGGAAAGALPSDAADSAVGGAAAGALPSDAADSAAVGDAAAGALPSDAADSAVGGGVTGTKHGAWSAYIDAMHSAWDYGAYCALLIDGDGVVVDGDRVTPVIRMEDRLLYPPPREGAVESITVRVLADALAAAAADGQGGAAQLRLEEGRFTLQDVLEAEEVAVVGSGVGVGRLVNVNGTAIGAGAGAGDDVNVGMSMYRLLRESLAGAKEAGWEVLARR